MPKSNRQQRREDLAATAESLHADATRVASIEREKLDLEIDDPRLDTLSLEAERLAVQIQHKSRVERDLADDEPDAPRKSPSDRN
jgi:hypothetical protein